MSVLFKAIIQSLIRLPNCIDNLLAAVETVTRVGRKAAENWESELDIEARKLAQADINAEQA